MSYFDITFVVKTQTHALNYSDYWSVIAWHKFNAMETPNENTYYSVTPELSLSFIIGLDGRSSVLW